MKKGLTIAMAAALVLFCAAIVTVYVSIGSIIVDTVEAEGTDLTQTRVTLEEADFSPTTGTATLLKLKVSNPKGFSSPTAFSFDTIELWVDPETLPTDTLHIRSLIIAAPEIIYELSSSTDNLRTLKHYIENSSKQSVSGKKLIIDNFYIKNGVVIVQAEELQGERKTARLADIHLKDIGRLENGLTPAEAVQQILTPVLRQTTLAALKTDLNLSDQARNILNGALDETEKAFNSLKNLLNQ